MTREINDLIWKINGYVMPCSDGKHVKLYQELFDSMKWGRYSIDGKMSSLPQLFKSYLLQDTKCDNVNIKCIKIQPLYKNVWKQ